MARLVVASAARGAYVVSFERLAMGPRTMIISLTAYRDGGYIDHADESSSRIARFGRSIVGPEDDFAHDVCTPMSKKV